MSNRKERLLIVFNELRYNNKVSTKKELADRLRIDKTNLSSAFNGVEKYLTDNLFNKIADTFPMFSRTWLLTGEGEMLNMDSPAPRVIRTSAGDIDSTTVLLLPVSAQGGSLNDFIVSVKENDCEKVVSPIRGVDFAMTVSGDSMAPEYPSGSRILIKKINERAFIEWGKVYVLDTCNGSIIKILTPSEQEGHVRCLSINPDPVYAPFDVAMCDIYGIYKVLLCMSTK